MKTVMFGTIKKNTWALLSTALEKMNVLKIRCTIKTKFVDKIEGRQEELRYVA